MNNTKGCLLMFHIGLSIFSVFCADNFQRCSNLTPLQPISLIIYIYKPSMDRYGPGPLPEVAAELKNKTILIFVDFRDDTVLSSFELYLRAAPTDYQTIPGNNVPGEEAIEIETRMKYQSSNIYIVYSDVLPYEIKKEIFDHTGKDTSSREYSERIASLLYAHFQYEDVKASTRVYPLETNKTYYDISHYKHNFRAPLQIEKRGKFVLKVTGQTPSLSRLFGDHIELNINYLVSYHNNECNVSFVQINRFRLHSGNPEDWVRIASKAVSTWIPKSLGLLDLILSMKEETTSVETNYENVQGGAAAMIDPMPSTSYHRGARNAVTENAILNLETDDDIDYGQLEELEDSLVFNENETELLDSETLKLYLNK